MTSRTFKTAVGLAGAGAALAGGHQALLRKWRDNPDPLNGKPATFPDGESRFVETPDGATIHTVTAGSGPTVVLVHGITVNMAHWGLIAERLITSGHRVIGVDQRGHGQSIVGSASYSPELLGDDLAAVFEQLDITDAVLAGHSMGGMASMTFAIRHSDLARRVLRGLVLVATTPELPRLRTELGIVAVPKNITTRYRVGAGLTTFGAEPSLNMIDETLAMANETPFANRRIAGRGLRGFDIEDQLGSITQETIVLAGTRDLVTPMAGNVAIAEAIPNASLIKLEHAGHSLIWERADDVQGAIEHLSSAVPAVA
ncbi:MAG: alpha/beta fold hydrolase [Acidimicrobiia bacterium]|nr:alpha/beta fold hydrolase [Acidimicrobiia bacterium]